MNRIKPADLTSESPSTKDLRLLLVEYENELQERRLADIAQLLEIACEAIQFEPHPEVGLPLVLLDVNLLSPLHTALVKALVDRSQAAIAIVHCNDPEGVTALESSFGVKAADAETVRENVALSQVRRYLFSPERPLAITYDPSVDLFAAPGEGIEAVEIARRIRKLAEDGVRFDDVAVLLRNPERYQGLIEEALSRAGVPTYFSRGSARPDPAGRAFLALLACAAENISASRFAEYLSLGQTPPLDATGAPLRAEPSFVSPDDDVFLALGAPAAAEEERHEDGETVATPIAWEKLLVDAAVIGGRERWSRRLNGLEQEYRFQLQSLEEVDEPVRGRPPLTV